MYVYVCLCMYVCVYKASNRIAKDKLCVQEVVVKKRDNGNPLGEQTSGCRPGEDPRPETLENDCYSNTLETHWKGKPLAGPSQPCKKETLPGNIANPCKNIENYLENKLSGADGRDM